MVNSVDYTQKTLFSEAICYVLSMFENDTN